MTGHSLTADGATLRLDQMLSVAKVGIRDRLSSVFEPEEWEVSGILAHRKRGQHTEFLVQWAGCSYLQSTWEPESCLAHAQRCLTAYMAKATKIEVAVVDALLMDPERLGRVLD